MVNPIQQYYRDTLLRKLKLIEQIDLLSDRMIDRLYRLTFDDTTKTYQRDIGLFLEEMDRLEYTLEETGRRLTEEEIKQARVSAGFKDPE